MYRLEFVALGIFGSLSSRSVAGSNLKFTFRVLQQFLKALVLSDEVKPQRSASRHLRESLKNERGPFIIVICRQSKNAPFRKGTCAPAARGASPLSKRSEGGVTALVFGSMIDVRQR